MWQCGACRKKVAVQGDTCPKCGRWNTLNYLGRKEIVAPSPEAPSDVRGGPRLIEDVRDDTTVRISTGLEQWDFAFSGGLVAGSTAFLAGDAGTGKTTSCLAIAPFVAHAMGGQALYLSAEMVEGKLRDYARRIGSRTDNLLVWHVTQLEPAIEAVRRLRPKCVVWDSIQRFRARHYDADTEHAMKEIAKQAAAVTKEHRSVTIILSQVTSQMWAKVPHGVTHDLDLICYLEPARFVVDKNRDGATRIAPRQVPGQAVVALPTPKVPKAPPPQAVRPAVPVPHLRAVPPKA